MIFIFRNIIINLYLAVQYVKNQAPKHQKKFDHQNPSLGMDLEYWLSLVF